MDEKRATVMGTVGGLFLSMLCAYGIITYGHCWIFEIGIGLGSLLTLAGLVCIFTDKEEN